MSDKAFEPGDLTYFEIFTHDNSIPTVPKSRYLLARGYTGGTESELSGKQENTRRNPQAFIGSYTIGDLVDNYINASTFGHGILPVRNMPSDDEARKLGYSPLKEEDMNEFKRLLKIFDPERYKLSFLKK